MTSLLNRYQEKINYCNAEIAAYNDEITMIDAEIPTNQSVAEYLTSRKNKLQNQITLKTQMLNTYQQLYDNEFAIMNASFTPEQQAIVDTIDPKYSKYMDKLKIMSDDMKNTFFNLYQSADNDVQRACIINNFFGIL